MARWLDGWMVGWLDGYKVRRNVRHADPVGRLMTGSACKVSVAERSEWSFMIGPDGYVERVRMYGAHLPSKRVMEDHIAELVAHPPEMNSYTLRGRKAMRTY